ncbi:DNA replication protein DnaD [Gordoniibacillus kamchatkensis]|uniref:DNA replication protein DnaD n=1 Tax=Gordoniibacillus kamchatkensis TaxID=1590651 RepID=A0ABR5AG89_9BACL|nr:DnaD domain protein [Paenibacillus sp. VKM B-2647]KIL40039.1 DNA replication protein DnaD [Paenibacillus sp. VKM B-2647]
MRSTGSDRKRLETYALAGLRQGEVHVPYILLKSYKALKLGEQEAMLLIQLMAFVDKEHKEFPTIDELQSRMAAPPEAVIASLQKLLKLGLVTIDERTDETSGVLYERYNFEPLFGKLAELLAAEVQAAEQARAAASAAADGGAASEKNVFTIFENEFARPLTPMELETISAWLDKDNYKEELILAALKEAVFAGKLHFRYIDRILLEWSRNRVQTAEQAKEFTQRFRSGGMRT